MDLDHLEEVLATGRVGTVVATLGTTGLGALDPLPDILERARAAGARVHVDTAYGGFFALVADDSPDGVASGAVPRDRRQSTAWSSTRTSTGCSPTAAARCCSATRRSAASTCTTRPTPTSAPTSCTSARSRSSAAAPGAAAAALWLTLEVLPLTDAGLGQALRADRRGALEWAALLGASDALAAYQAPELDIVTYFPRRPTLSTIDAASEALFHAAAAGDPTEQIHLATYTVTGRCAGGARARRRAPTSPAARILRSTVMKPESETYVAAIHARLEELVPALTLVDAPPALSADACGRRAP